MSIAWDSAFLPEHYMSHFADMGVYELLTAKIKPLWLKSPDKFGASYFPRNGSPFPVFVLICPHVVCCCSEHDLSSKDIFLQKTPISFDVSVRELFFAFWVGAELVFAEPGGHRDTQYLAQLIASRGITCCSFVPSQLEIFLQVSYLIIFCDPLFFDCQQAKSQLFMIVHACCNFQSLRRYMC